MVLIASDILVLLRQSLAHIVFQTRNIDDSPEVSAGIVLRDSGSLPVIHFELAIASYFSGWGESLESSGYLG